MYNEVWQHGFATVKNIFTEELTDTLARESQYTRRSTGKISPMGLLFTLTVTVMAHPLISLDGMCESISDFTGYRVSAQALSQRLGSVYAVRFLRRCLAYLMSLKSQNYVARLKDDGILGLFSNIYIEDSTTCNLHEHVSPDFKGVGGDASKAGYKINAVWNATTSDFASLAVSPSAINDHSLSHDILEHLKKGDLLLRDLGYFSLPCFEQIINKGAFFLTRLNASTKIYSPEGKSIKDVGIYLDKLCTCSNATDHWLYIGAKKKLKVRLIAFKVPESVYNERMRKKRRASQKRGTQPSKETKAITKFTVLITNIPESMVSTDQIPVLYCYRWQIELHFKAFKSNLYIDLIKGQSKERVECYILSRLIAIIATTQLFSQLAQYMNTACKRELSYHKFTATVARNELLRSMFSVDRDNFMMIQRIDIDILKLCKQKRDRRTTTELLQQKASIWEKFEENPIEVNPPVAA